MAVSLKRLFLIRWEPESICPKVGRFSRSKSEPFPFSSGEPSFDAESRLGSKRAPLPVNILSRIVKERDSPDGGEQRRIASGLEFYASLPSACLIASQSLGAVYGISM